MLWIALWAGCAPPATIEEACGKGFPGDDLLSTDTARFFERITCHRRFVGLGPARVVGPAQDAANAHAVYLESNGVLDPSSENYVQTIDDLFIEDDAWSGFTGVTALDRLQAAEMVQAVEGSIGTWDVFLGDLEFDPDSFIADPYLRDVMFQPGWIGAGMGELDNEAEGTRAGYLNLLYAYPPSRRMFKPIVFPRDGQTDVRQVFTTYGHPSDPLSVSTRVGYPITVTVGSDRVDDAENPYLLEIDDAELVDEDGTSWELVQAGPGNYPWGANTATQIFATLDPLLPGTTYTFTATVVWNVRTAEVESTFTTFGGDDDGL
jgi:hypothetical protein